MNITITPSARDQKRLGELAQALEGAFKRIERRVWESAFDQWVLYVGLIFEDEGFPSWHSLAEITAEERSKILDPDHAEHPILHRRGFLENSLTERRGHSLGRQAVQGFVEQAGGPKMPLATGNIIIRVASDNEVTYRFGTLDPRFRDLQDGTVGGGRKIPARPMVPMGEQRAELGMLIEKSVMKWLKKEPLG